MPNSVIYQTLFPIKNSFDTGRLGLGQTLVQNGKKEGHKHEDLLPPAQM